MTKDESIKHIYETMKDADIRRHDKYTQWIKNIVYIAAGLVSVLTTLRGGKSDNYTLHLLFSITISGLSLGILTGIICTFQEVHVLDKHRKLLWTQIGKRLYDLPVDTTIHHINPSVFFVISKYTFYISLTISLFCLVCYSILKDI
jgi:hypothetical protein